MDLILATRNAHKVREVSRMLAPYGLGVQGLPEHVVLPPEDGDTFQANALIKARAAASSLGVAVIADDSGIEAAALGGRPGVRSARFAGEHATDQENVAKLLAEAPADSDLRYVCALAYVGPGWAQSRGGDTEESGTRGGERVFHGECRGRLAAAPRGSGGFGYDPVFVPEDRPGGRTMAELPEADKDAISHRGRAVRAFAQWFTGGTS
ncbi:MAG TPA: non-canonical purine NTP pyrophosphatase [Solirubrobacteraceae bacterium]|nr:non-canonical purine NTP pyrophosphatase [Solirubrobacteraceae bacterium]